MSPKVDIKQIEITDELEFVFMACDGIYDVLSNEDVVMSVHDEIYKDSFDENAKARIDLKGPLEEFVDGCCPDTNPGDGKGTDNMSAILIEFLRK